ncbi:MAG: thiolase family protein [Anaerolineae bacterium]|jgi:acetyl-CoA C-acetyltransferase
MNEVVVVSAVRTPFGNFGGTLKDFTLPDLGGQVITEALRRVNVPPEAVEEVAMGVNLPGSDRSIARQAALRAGIPDTTPAYTVDRACCSSMAAVNTVSRSLRLGEASVVVGGGTENMSLVPYFVHDARWGKRLGDIVLTDQLIISCPYSGKARALQAGEEAIEFGVSREEQDRWALRSHQRVMAAQESGFFEAEILPIEVPQRKGPPLLFEKDEAVRPNTSLEKLARLRTIYDSPTVTPGNAPGLSTGASAVVLTTRQEAERRGVQPLATIKTWAMVAGHPDRIASIPATAAQKALDQVGMTVDDMDLIEINEAFAAMPLVATHILGGGDPANVDEIREKTNVNGGAIAIGHPTGASGARLLMTIIYALKSRGERWGLAAICGGIGQGEAMIVEVES